MVLNFLSDILPSFVLCRRRTVADIFSYWPIYSVTIFAATYYRSDVKLRMEANGSVLSEEQQTKWIRHNKKAKRIFLGDPFLPSRGIESHVCERLPTHLNDNFRISNIKWIINRFTQNLSLGKCLRWLNFYSMHNFFGVCKSDFLSTMCIDRIFRRTRTFVECKMDWCRCRSAFVCIRGTILAFD